MTRDFPSRECVADIVRAPYPARRSKRAGASGKAAGGERYIGRHAHISRGDPFGDPVIRDIGAIADGDHAHVRPVGRPDRPGPVRHQVNLEAEPVRDAVDFVADRTGVAVDIDFRQSEDLAVMPPTACRPAAEAGDAALPGPERSGVTAVAAEQTRMGQCHRQP